MELLVTQLTLVMMMDTTICFRGMEEGLYQKLIVV